MTLEFAWPWALWFGLPLLAVTVALVVRQGRATRQLSHRWWLLLGLRAAALLMLLILLAQPLLVQSREELSARRQAIVLLDMSESMAIREQGTTRYQRALDYARTKLLPALQARGLQAQAIAFAEDPSIKSGTELATLVPNGKKTNLARALTVAVSSTDKPPVAIFALTDGSVNVDQDQRRGVSAIATERVPVVGLGIGTDVGPQTIGIQFLDAPTRVSPNQEFRVAVQLESGGAGVLPPLELILLRDDQLVDRRSLPAQNAGRIWRESFTVSEKEEGQHKYRVELLPPGSDALRLQQRQAEGQVRVSEEKELRVLFVQSALTWDYKFLRMALASDPTIRLAGLSRTSNSSFYYQDYESSEAASGGFPRRLEDLAPYSVVVLSSMRHSDLTTAQQELLTRYVGELGGGLLLIGGGETFDSSWKGSQLEKLLAVRFSDSYQTNAPRFALQLTDPARQHPAFQIGGDGEGRSGWESIQAFQDYAEVDEAKPGATIWATHPSAPSPRGPRILMASQRFGAGLSAVICVQDFWRWRLAKPSNPRQFDRFWQQWLRYLADSQRESLVISVLDQQLRVGGNVQAQLRRTRPSSNSPASSAATTTNAGGTAPGEQESGDGVGESYELRVLDGRGQQIHQQRLALVAGGQTEVSFPTATAGNYLMEVRDANEILIASRTVEVRDENLEWLRPIRVMDTLEQWATLSGGMARKIEQADDADELVRQVLERSDEARRLLPDREPLGINGWMLSIIAGCLAAEWILRKRWGKT